MAYEGNTGLQVASQYGARNTGASVGVETTKMAIQTLSIELTGSGLADKFLPPLVVPKNATFKRAVLTVNEAFSGVTAVSVGEGNDEDTNGITLAAADLAVGTRDVTSKLTGTWAATSAVAKPSRVGMAVTGTPDPKVGRASIVIEYFYKTRKDTEWKPDASTFPTYRAQP